MTDKSKLAKGAEPWLNSGEAAQYLGLKSVGALHKRINKGDIPSEFIHRWGKSLRFRASELDQLINAGETTDEQS